MSLKNSQTTDPKPSGNGIPGNMGMDHIGVVVPNAQQAADFLIEVFDAEFDWEVKREPHPTAGERGWDITFDIPANVYLAHVIMLKCGDLPLTQYIELFEWQYVHAEKQHCNQPWPKFHQLANNYISFTVKDMDKVIAHIKHRIITKWPQVKLIQDPPMRFPLRGEICTSTFLTTPWGMWIELTHWSASHQLGEVIAAQRDDAIDPSIGLPIQKLPTPSLMIDLDIIDHNTQLMSQRFDQAGIDWRIPCKAHKCPELAQYLLAKGACGVVLLTLQEAEAFAKHGIDDIYLANQVGCDDDIRRLSILAKQLKRLRAAVDSIDYLQRHASAVQAWEIMSPIEILVEIDVNHHRCGVNTIDEALSIAIAAKDIELTHGSIIFAGITGYEGHTPVLEPQQKSYETQRSHDKLAQAKTLIEAHGIPVRVISGGGSCNYQDCLNTGILTEVQAGGGAICDRLYSEKAQLKNFGHQMGALLLAQVISCPQDKSRAIGNAGFKQLGWHPFGGYPILRDHNDIEVIGLSAEHTKLCHRDSGSPIPLAWGDKFVMIPGYLDAMGFLHQQIYAIRNDIVVAKWSKV